MAAIAGPDAKPRTDGITFDASASTGGTDTWGDSTPITKVEWDLDGATGYEENSGTSLTINKTYPKGFALGQITVRVKVSSGTRSDTDTHQITITNKAPSVSFSSNDNTPIVGQAVTFAGTVTDADSASAGYQWDKGSGWCDFWTDPTCMSSSFTRSFGAPGTYTIKLRGHDSDNGHTDVAHQVIVRAAPTAALTTESPVVLAGENVTLDASGSTGESLSYRWDLDGDTGNGFEVDGGQSATRTAAFPAGQRSVRVQVTDNDTATAESAPLELTVHDAPTAAFTFGPAAPLTGQAVTFNATAADDDGIADLEWDLDGDAGNGFEVDGGTSVQRTYTAAGTYTVRLRVTDGRGATRTVSQTVTVKAPVTQNPPPKDEGTQNGGGVTPIGGGSEQSQNPKPQGGSPVAGGGPATKGAGAKKAKKRCKTVKVKRKGKTGRSASAARRPRRPEALGAPQVAPRSRGWARHAPTLSDAPRRTGVGRRAQAYRLVSAANHPSPCAPADRAARRGDGLARRRRRRRRRGV